MEPSLAPLRAPPVWGQLVICNLCTLAAPNGHWHHIETLFLAGVLWPTVPKVDPSQQLVMVEYSGGGKSLDSWLEENRAPGVIRDQWQPGLPELVRLPASSPTWSILQWLPQPPDTSSALKTCSVKAATGGTT